jgi:hypothetical protein
MEATRQAERAVKAWADTQIKVWESWIGTVESSTTGKSGLWDQMRKSTLDSLEKSVAKTLDAQAELTHALTESLAGIWTSSEETADRVRIAEIDSVTKSATEAQKQLWASWFDAVKKVETSQLAAGWQKVLDAWQQAIRKALETQAQWFEVQAQEKGRATKRAEQ